LGEGKPSPHKKEFDVKKVIVAVALILMVSGLMAVDISPEMSQRNLFYECDGYDTLVLPTDSIVSPWIKGTGEMSEGSFVWAISGDGSGSLDSLITSIQFCFQSNWNETGPDTTYLPPWDTLHTIINDTIGFKPLNEFCHEGRMVGWSPGAGWWVRTKWRNFDSDTGDIHIARFDMAGSK
jgi:hypothetical protein